MGATEGAWRKNKCGKNESLMEPKAGIQGDNLNVHYSQIRSWSSLRLITEFAECTSFIVICNSPSPQATRASGKTKDFGSIPRSLWLCLPTLLPHLPSGQLCSAEGEGPSGARASQGLAQGLCVSVLLPPQVGPAAFLSQALSATYPQRPSSPQGV